MNNPAIHLIELVNGVLQITFLESPGVEDFYTALNDVVAHESNRFRLWDFSCGLDWSSNDLRKIAEYAKSTMKVPSSKIAIIAPGQLTYGLFRMHDVFREDEFSEQRVFRSKKEALDWLKEVASREPN